MGSLDSFMVGWSARNFNKSVCASAIVAREGPQNNSPLTRICAWYFFLLGEMQRGRLLMVTSHTNFHVLDPPYRVLGEAGGVGTWAMGCLSQTHIITIITEVSLSSGDWCGRIPVSCRTRPQARHEQNTYMRP